MTKSEKIKRAAWIMGWQFEIHDLCHPGWYRVDKEIPGVSITLNEKCMVVAQFSPFVNANHDLILLEWAREHLSPEQLNKFGLAFLDCWVDRWVKKYGNTGIHSLFIMYSPGDYCSALVACSSKINDVMTEVDMKIYDLEDKELDRINGEGETL